MLTAQFLHKNELICLVLDFIIKDNTPEMILSKSFLTLDEVNDAITILQSENFLDVEYKIISSSLSEEIKKLIPIIADKAFIKNRCERLHIDAVGRLEWIEGMAQMIGYAKQKQS